MRVLIGAECSGMIRRAFAARGHFVVSVDIKPAEDGPSKWDTADYSTGWHYQGDLIDFIYGDAGGLMDAGFDLGIFNPECRFLCNSGAKHLYRGMKKKNGRDPKRWRGMYDAASFFAKCYDAPIGKIAVENSIMHEHGLAAVGRGAPLADHSALAVRTRGNESHVLMAQETPAADADERCRTSAERRDRAPQVGEGSPDGARPEPQR